MRRIVPVLTSASLVVGATAVLAVPAAAATSVTSVAAGHSLVTGQRLVSADGRYRAALESTGRLVVRTAAGRYVSATPSTAAGATLSIARTGQMWVHAGSHRWYAGTSGAGSSVVLRLRNDGGLSLTAGSLAVWTTRVQNACPRTSGRTFVVDLSEQTARMCSGGQQIRATQVMTGATSLGNGTPRGTWHVQNKVRNTTLYPASGGAYPVKYWVPYDGAYGIHDSPWQHFAYGSAKYRTQGSHGCTHVPAAAMAWFYSWVRVGTTVTVHS